LRKTFRDFSGAVILSACCLGIGCMTAAGQEQTNLPAQPENSPQNPPPKPEQKDEGSSPAQAAAEKTKELSTQAAAAGKKFGELTLTRVRDWESGWLTGPYTGRSSRPLAPLTARQRRDIYLAQTFTSPAPYLKRLFVAGVDQARGVPHQWDDGWAGYGERFASRQGQFITANSLAALGNAALKYDPLYDECACRGFKLRTRHAILRNFLTYNQTEQQLRPQLALYGGAFAGGVISTSWRPHPRNALAQGGYAVLGQAGYGALLNFIIEFAGDINRKLGSKRRDVSQTF
jgi:hypothetical protein